MTSVVWQDVDPAVLGMPGAVEDLDVNGLLDALHHGRAGQSLLTWYEYRFAAALHSHLVTDTEMSDVRAVDEYAQCAARIAMRLNLSQNSGERLLHEAVALRDRLPAVNACLKSGIVTGQQVRLIVTRTELIDGQPYASEVDAAIADALKRRGSWSTARLRNMVDRIVFRHDPDAVRRRRQGAHDDRGFWITPGEDGMAELGATMSAENARIAYDTVRALAATVCKHDPRTKRARASDAAFSLLAGERFECLCARTDCDATIPDPTPVQQAHARIIIHVICTDTTLTDGDDPALMDGYGVISADHTRDLAQRLDTRTRHLNPRDRGRGDTNGAAPTQPDPASGKAEATDSGNACTADASGVPAADDRETSGTPDEPHSDPTGSRDSTQSQPNRTGDDTVPDDYTRSTETVSDADESAVSEWTDETESKPGGHAEDDTGIPPDQPPPPKRRRAELRRDSESSRPTDNSNVDAPPLPATLPSNPYRPSAALDAFVRIRDGYCVIPGCNQPAWGCDLDHVTEYDHANPTAGGQTTPAGLNSKCRFHHLLKSHSDWLDDQTLDPHGRPHTITITPEGYHLPGPADTGEDLFPDIRHIRFDEPPLPSTPPEDTARPRPRIAEKHARRRTERENNRQQREHEQAERQRRLREAQANDPPPPF